MTIRVAQFSRVGPSLPVLTMAEAIIGVECGGNPYSSDELEDGLRLAGVVKPVTPALLYERLRAAIAKPIHVVETANYRGPSPKRRLTAHAVTGNRQF